jgi:hypothetical protein
MLLMVRSCIYPWKNFYTRICILFFLFSWRNTSCLVKKSTYLFVLVNKPDLPCKKKLIWIRKIFPCTSWFPSWYNGTIYLNVNITMFFFWNSRYPSWYDGTLPFRAYLMTCLEIHWLWYLTSPSQFEQVYNILILTLAMNSARQSTHTCLSMSQL